MIFLASASPRRAKILSELGVAFEVVAPQAEEILWVNDPRRTAERNARVKLNWCRARHPHGSIIAADTVIDFEGRCLTKPVSRAEAFDFLRRFSGRQQTVITAVALVRPGEPVQVERVESSVTFKVLDDRRIGEYFRRVDPMDKAGAYDIDQAGEWIIQAVIGSRTNIMGLPRERIERWLAEGARREVP